MDFISGQTLLEVCEKEKLPISEVMKQREITCGKMPEKEIREKLYEVLRIMKEAVEEPIRQPKKSMGGLIGGNGLLCLWASTLESDFLQHGSTGSQRVHGTDCGGTDSGISRSPSGGLAFHKGHEAGG